MACRPASAHAVRGGIRARSAVARLCQITGPLRPATTDPPGLEPGQTRLELAVLPVTPRIYACARLESNQQPPPSHGGALPLSYGRLTSRSLRQESNPHLGRTKGACLPLTLRRLGWRRWESNPRPPRCKRGALPPELRPPGVQCGRVESNHHSARRRGYSPLSSPMLSVRVNLGVAERTRTDTAGLTTPDAALHHGHHELRGRPGSNRRPLA